jgi:hypothetical protein
VAFNGRFGNIGCNAAKITPQLQANAAPATRLNVNVSKVRTL